MQREHIEDATTRATARLPGLEIEIVHQRPSPDGEQISIHLRAAPSFEAFGQWLESANPFAFWTRVAQMVWLPWLAAADNLKLPWNERESGRNTQLPRSTVD